MDFKLTSIQKRKIVVCIFLYILMFFLFFIFRNHKFSNIFVLIIGIYILLGDEFLNNRIIEIIFNFLWIFILTMLLWPLKFIDIYVYIFSLITFSVLFLFVKLFNTRINELRTQIITNIENIKNQNNKIAQDLKIAEKEFEEIDAEITNITSLYAAAKDLNYVLKIDDCIEIILSVIKKIIKTNFKIALENVGVILIIKKYNKFVIGGSINFDEAYLKDNEEKIIKNIIKNIDKKFNIEYRPRIRESDNLGFIKSTLTIPFNIGSQLMGALFISGRKENIFSTKYIDSLKVLAVQISITLEKAHLYDEVEQMSITDSLTGLYVHRYMQDKLENELKRAYRYSKKLSLIMGDIDFFKKVNDTYGHLAGDYILKEIALIFKNNTTGIDTVARYGGEEFIIILPDKDKESAFLIAEKIRKNIENYPFKFKNINIKITMSLGVATYPDDAISRRNLIEKVDSALYKAKTFGRNRVIKA